MVLSPLLLPVVTVVRHVVGFVFERDRTSRRYLGVLLVSGRSAVVRLRVGRLVQILLRIYRMLAVVLRLFQVFAVVLWFLVFAVWRVHGPGLGQRSADVRRPVVVAAVSKRAIVVLEIGFTQLEEPNEAGHDQCQETEHLLERSQAQDERQEKEELQLEQLEHDQQRDQ